MAEKFIKYRTFNDKAVASELCALLSEHQIPFEWESTEGFFDVSFAGNDILNLYYVKIRQQDFAKADQLLMDSVIREQQQPVGDYYLFSFSDTELLDVIHKPDEWNEFDLYWARKILQTRGVEIKKEQVEEAKKERIKYLKKPWELNKVWVFGVIAVLLVSIVTGFFHWAFGVVLFGAYIVFSKRTMPDGDRVYAFSPLDRQLGKIAMIVGALLTLVILYLLYEDIEFPRPL